MNDHPTAPDDGPAPGSVPFGSTPDGRALFVSLQDMTVDIWGPRQCKPLPAGWKG